MKKTLLATVAVVALVAGNGIAASEGAPKQEAPAQRTESPSPAPSAQQNAPAEKMAPGHKGAQNNRASDSKSTTGQGESGSQMGREPSQQPGRTQRSPSADEHRGATGQNERRGTTGQGERGERGMQRSEPSRGATQPQTGQGTTSQQPNAQQGAQQQRSGTQQQQTTGSAPASGGVNLTSEQKTEIRSTVLTANAPRVSNVNFAVNVGTVVPRSVNVVAVPETLVRIHPAWRGHRYFVYNDEIIIVEPDTMKIVAVLTV